MNRTFRRFVPFAKVDEDLREVWGDATDETLDKQNEIVSFEAAKKAFGLSADYFHKVSKGKSKGNIRSMHQPIAAGRIIAWDADEELRSIPIGTKIDDDAEWNKCKLGTYIGFSIAGEVTKEHRTIVDGKSVNVIDEFELMETSLVDNPANPSATFSVVKMHRPEEAKKTHRSEKWKKLLESASKDMEKRLEGMSIYPALESLRSIQSAIENEAFMLESQDSESDVAGLRGAVDELLSFLMGAFEREFRSYSSPEGDKVKDAASLLGWMKGLVEKVKPEHLKKMGEEDEEMKKNLDAIHKMGHGLVETSKQMGADCPDGDCPTEKEGEEEEVEKVEGEEDPVEKTGEEDPAEKTGGEEPKKPDPGATGKVAGVKKLSGSGQILKAISKVGEAIGSVKESVESLDKRVKKIEGLPASVGRTPARPAHKTLGAGGEAVATVDLASELRKLAEQEDDPIVKQKLALKAATMACRDE